ncbi:aldolase/citrate lyase family protein [Aurantimonas sp. C2-6-R+9]|uniref:HpcH/HpaI aldolase family protein n=1 Tax=unclassified Aurantimonas TaxID=2638230 RepID=UPI002E16FC00|nr:MULTISPECIES: aldolase/citrate lyase family protein [unclassified Aurantimonas]MEC5291739.1 aldolase/citrate lyase family protein [Aurantimonas sp. C2-3-R2]MEC5381904.1 aldolase/citrate lyase family protein [Aurantimonas sp. C2-6-R+9]MEC5412807.1 aldolase/citrate lyase family protein [Aurantimonas sp. C2-4-R8]
MALPRLRDRLGEGGFVVSAWLGLIDPVVHEAFLRADFDAVTFDAQHGLHDTASLRAGIERAVLLGKPALVRLPIEDRALAARLLDFGASAVMMPMIETADEARAFVAVAKYPPFGQRSYGPTRAGELHGYADRADYVTDARNETLAFAMIETGASVANLEAILAVDGLDGVFVGPSDLSIALSGDGTLDPRGAQAEAAIKRIAAATSAAGKIATIYAATPEDAKRYREYGYRLVCVSSDQAVIAAGARALAEAVRG